MTADGDRTVHPFFRQANGSHDQLPQSHAEVEPEGDGPQIDQLDVAGDDKPKTKRTRRTKAQLEEEKTGKKQRTLQDIINPKPRQEAEVADNVAECPVDLVSSDLVIDPSRWKRRRITPTHQEQRQDEREIANSTSDAPPFTGDATGHINQARAPGSPRVIIPASSPVCALPAEPVTTVDDSTTMPQTPPRKTLRLNANGKFSSPVTKKLKAEETSPAAPKRRGRPRKSKDAAEQKRQTVVLSYANHAAEVGAKIDRILSGEDRVEIETPRKPTPKKPRTPKKSNKPPHPFFTGKPKEQPKSIKLESPRKVSATTPGKLRRQIMADRPPEVNREVPYAVGSALLKDRLMIRHPGARDPPWPDREQAHVRGLDGVDGLAHVPNGCQTAGRKRKRKAAQLTQKEDESILHRFGEHVKPELETAEHVNGSDDHHNALRRPARLLITGQKIRQRIAHELAATLNEVDLTADVLLKSTLGENASHPALRRIWNLIPTSLSAFDELRGENVGWAQKYAPETVEEVLQPSHELGVLRDWLNSLTVSAVEHVSTASVKTGMKAEPKPRKKRRRKHDDLDDFLVDDDEDVHDMDELTDPEETNLVSTGLRSIVQSAARGAKLSNAVLLSGPPGCGKTAAAYAVAKELGFKVFEISSSERRSGKDVLDKIGDMTENHLVRHHGVDPGELSSTEDNNKERLDEAFQRDLASGRQGKMATFFKPQAAMKRSAAPKPKAVQAKVKTLKAVEEALKKPPKDQQQSLILLEEVDILFKDDREFWNTIFKLIVSSKRPFIMTCNDEDMVPLQAMNLYAILRFTPPPVDLAADYLLLVAAAEGHQLKRKAVTALYEAKQRDMRASIVELDFWCQMAVGDPKGGLGWIHQRYPPGCDIDEHGQRLRVVSEDTYQQGMGMAPEAGLSEGNQMLWAWREYGVEPTSLLDPPVWYPNDDGAVGQKQMYGALRNYAKYAEVQSALDAFAGKSCLDALQLDTTTPDMPDKARHHYIEGLPLLQTDDRTDHEDLSSQLVVASVRAVANACLADSAPLQTKLTHAMSGANNDRQPPRLTRHDFAVFDTISTNPESALSAGPGLTQSAFDGPTSIIATDLAPYVRSIVQFDIALEEQRERLNSIMADGDSRKAKRARTTRAARSALEGSQRASTRRERWFVKGLDLKAVLRTGGSEWPKTELGTRTAETESMDGCEPPVSSAEAV